MKEELASAAVSGEDEVPAGPKEPKRKRGRKLKKGAGPNDGEGAPEDGDEALSSHPRFIGLGVAVRFRHWDEKERI